MLDVTKLKKGDHVFRVALVDVPDVVLPQMVVLEYEITQLGKVFMETRYVFIGGKHRGQLGGADKSDLGRMKFRYHHTPLAAVLDAKQRVANNLAAAQRTIAECGRQSEQLEELHKGVLAAAVRS